MVRVSPCPPGLCEIIILRFPNHKAIGVMKEEILSIQAHISTLQPPPLLQRTHYIRVKEAGRRELLPLAALDQLPDARRAHLPWLGARDDKVVAC